MNRTESRRRAAKERQSAILAQFAAQRKSFLRNVEEGERGTSLLELESEKAVGETGGGGIQQEQEQGVCVCVYCLFICVRVYVYRCVFA